MRNGRPRSGTVLASIALLLAGCEGASTDRLLEPDAARAGEVEPVDGGSRSLEERRLPPGTTGERYDADRSSAPAMVDHTCDTTNADARSEVRISGVMLVVVLLLGVMAFVVMRWIRKRIQELSWTKPRKALFVRARPLVEAIVTILYLVASVRLVLGDHPVYATVGLGLILLGLVWISWFAVRDVVAGMLLKASEICVPGDRIEVGGVVGRVRSLGYRVIALDLPDGGQAFIPYSRISRETLVRKPVTDGLFRHRFHLQLEPDVDVVEAKAAVRRYALNSHWHSVVREPEIDVDETGTCTVTVFSIADNQGHRIEASVRKALVESPPGATGARRSDARRPKLAE